MEYEAALDILRRARVNRPAIVTMGGAFHIFERTRLLGSGHTIVAALRAAGKYPPPDEKPEITYSAKGLEVIKGREPICTALSKNSARRIANALNEYKPNQHGW
jgi:hypothetical protein